MDDVVLGAPIASLLRYAAAAGTLATRHELRTVRDLVALCAATVHADGPWTVHQFKEVDRAVYFITGRTWAEAHLELVGHAESFRPPSPDGRDPNWDLRWKSAFAKLPPHALALKVERAFPPRLAHACERAGLHFVSDLATREHMRLRGVGDKTLIDFPFMLERLGSDGLFGHDSWRSVFDSALARVRMRERAVVVARAGFGTARQTYVAIGRGLHVSTENVRRLERVAAARMTRGSDWPVRVERRLAAVVGAEPCRLSDLGARDSFLAVEQPDANAFTYFVNKLVCGDVRVIAAPDREPLAQLAP